MLKGLKNQTCFKMALKKKVHKRLQLFNTVLLDKS